MRKGVNKPVEEKIEIARQICELYALNKYTLNSCCKQFGVESDNTFYNWRTQIVEIGNLYKNAVKQKELSSKRQLRELATTSLFKLVGGHEVKETTIKRRRLNGGDTDIPTNINDNEGFIDEITVKTKVFAPVPSAVFYALGNTNDIENQDWISVNTLKPKESDVEGEEIKMKLLDTVEKRKVGFADDI